VQIGIFFGGENKFLYQKIRGGKGENKTPSPHKFFLKRAKKKKVKKM
jgi:hypothetical protein